MPKWEHPVPLALVPLWLQILEWSKSYEGVVRDLASVELFAGQMEITRFMLSTGRSSVAFDKSYYKDSTEDINTEQGFQRALSLVMRIQAGGSLWTAPVCSSWGFIGRSTTQRSSLNPGGNVFNNKVSYANRMVVLVSMLIMLAHSRHVWCWLEQPLSTVMQHFTPMKETIQYIMPYSQQVWLVAFGAESTKPLCIWCSSPLVHGLKRAKPSTSTKSLCTKTKTGVTGNKDDLVASAAYPPGFGKAVGTIMVMLQGEQCRPTKKRKCA